MNETAIPTLKPGDKLWGIYFTDREHAREMGDPLRTVVAAPTKLAAEEAANRLGFDSAWANPLPPEQARQIRGTATQPSQQSSTARQPTTAELRTAIEVLKMLDKRINEHVAHSVRQLPETELGEQYAAHLEARTIEQTGHIEKVSTQIQNWRDELLQQQKQQVTQKI